MTSQETDRHGEPQRQSAGGATVSEMAFDGAIGALVALAVLGPVLLPGPLLDFDLLVTPEIPVPDGVWGLGPALSQRVPLFALFGLGSRLIGGPATVKLFLVVGLTAGHVGMCRLVASFTTRLSRQAAGILWVAGPFIVTRIAAGHLQFVWLIAFLPWVLPVALRPSRRLRRTFPVLVVLASGGPATGTIAVVVTAVGLVLERRRRIAAVSLAVGVANLVWIAPTAVLAWAGVEVAGADRFTTSAHGIDGWLGVLVGGGFWSPTRQIGARGWLVGVAVVGLLAVAVLGHRRLPGWRSPLGVVGVLGLALTAASALPVSRDLYGVLSRLPIGAPLRESQRFLLLWLLWVAPTVAAGSTGLSDAVGDRFADHRFAGAFEETAGALPLAAVMAVSMGGWWGAGGLLAPVEYPAGWESARSFLREQDSTVVALPWNQYPPLDFIDGRHAFNPLPDFLGGDVVSSYDPQFDPESPAQEQVDRRARRLDEVLRGDGRMGPAFEEVGARFVVVIEQAGAPEITARLEAEPRSFERILENRDVTIWEVRNWIGPVVAPDGSIHDFDRPIPPILRTDAPPGSVLSVAGAPGWVRGWFHPAETTAAGLLRAPARGGGPLWFWPAPVLITVDLIVYGAAVVAGRSSRTRTPR